MEKIALGFLIWGCFAVKFPIILAISFALCPMVFAYAHVSSPSISRPLAWVSLNIAYWLISGLLTGGMYLPDLTSMDYWSGEGRAYLSYVPLLFVLGWRARPNIIPWLMNQFLLVAFLGFTLAAIWMKTKTPFLEVGSQGLFTGLQTSHSGAGMFWAVVCTILLIYGFEVNSRLHQLGGFLAVVPLFGAASREALFALVFAFGLWIFRKKGRKKYWVGAALGLMFSFIMVFAGQTIIDRTMVIFNLNGISSLTSNTTGTGAAQGSTISRDDSGLFNIRMRFLLWQDAVAKWTGSPICGLGFGRFNDTITQYDGIENLCKVATAGQKNYADQIQFSKDDEILSTGNAHNTYFQVLAELGLIGIILLIGLWACFWNRLGDTIREARRILAFRDGIDANDFLFLNRAIALSTAIRGAIICVGFGALFGDAWMAPSNMLILVAAIAVAEIVRRLILAFDEDYGSPMMAVNRAT